jgi:putative isomerase
VDGGNEEAANLLKLIRDAFYDQDSGYFYDRAILSKSRIKVAGPEGWIPLYTGVATPEQAEGVLQRMMDPTYFNTTIPLPTLAVNNKAFNPQNGYWRGAGLARPILFWNRRNEAIWLS